jgi:site-specific DNA-methyltransferase (adenine-specific)
MQTVDIPISELKAYDKNAKIHDAKQNEQIANSLLRFGWKQPLVVDKDNVLIVGHGRLEGAKIASKTDKRFLTAPCIIADDLTEEEIKAYRLADNKLNESPWDFDLLGEELQDITEIDMSDFGFDMSAFEEEPAEVVEDDYEESLPEQPKTKLGDIYQLGEHRLICGDSTDPAVIDRLMDGVKADMWLSDPPYNVEIVGGSHAISASERKKQGKLTIQNDCMSGDEFKEFLTNAFTTAYTALKGGASFYIWYASREVVNFQNSLEESGFIVKQELIWNKSSLVMGRQDYQWKHEPCLYGWKDGNSHNWYGDRKQTTIIDFERPSKSDLHPTMKPIGLLAIQIKNSSKTDDIIFDGFGGSGSTLIACEQLNRKCYMCELDPHYIDVIIDRWEKITGKKAVKLN